MTATTGERYPRTERQLGGADALYDARIEDLGGGDFLRVACTMCGHDEFIPRIGLVVGLRLPASMHAADLQSRFRCRECDRRGSVTISIKWAE